MTITTKRDGAVFHLVLDRAEKRNALTSDMLKGIDAALTDAERDPEVRVVLLRANGPHFCAGFDLNTLRSAELHEDRFVREEQEFFNKAMRLRNLPKPTIAAVQGGCIAGGLLFSQMCDLIIASTDAYFYNPLVKMGGVGLEVLMEPWDLGIRQAKRYLFTGEKIPAEVALRFGMITDLAPTADLLDEALKLAGKVAAMPPMTVRLLKKSINRTQDLMGMRDSLEQHFGLHEFGHTTQESAQLLHQARERQPLKEYFSEREKGELSK